jgi:hypothetical protein
MIPCFCSFLVSTYVLVVMVTHTFQNKTDVNGGFFYMYSSGLSYKMRHSRTSALRHSTRVLSKVPLRSSGTPWKFPFFPHVGVWEKSCFIKTGLSWSYHITILRKVSFFLARGKRHYLIQKEPVTEVTPQVQCGRNATNSSVNAHRPVNITSGI